MNTNKKPNYTTNNSKRSFRKPTLKDKLEKVPEHIRNIVYVLNNNAEIRRFTSLAMIDTLRKENVITENDKVYIKFNTNKFSIIINGLGQEQHYNNNFFIEAFESSFVSFAKLAKNLINTFCEVENKEIEEETKEQNENNDSSPVEG